MPAASNSTGNSDRFRRLGFYRLLNRLSWPRTFLGRLLLVCAAATGVPLIAALCLFAWWPENPVASPGMMLAVAVGAEVVGIGLMFAALRSALAPMDLSIDALDAYQRSGRLPQLPSIFDDEPGRLMREIRATIISAESQHADLVRDAETDPLTEVANRRRFLRLGSEMLAQARRDGTPLSLLVLDLDHFKDVNDGYGHAAGDGVLRMIAGLGDRFLRGGDLFARIGGEEFAALLPETPLPAALSVAERLRKAVAELPMPPLDGTTVTTSFGVAAAEACDATIEAVLHRADMALYDAKRSGRDRVAFRLPAEEERPGPAAERRFSFAALAVGRGAGEARWVVD